MTYSNTLKAKTALKATLAGLALLAGTTAVSADTPAVSAEYYAAGSLVSEQVEVQDKHGETHALRELMGTQGKSLNLVMIFGGGGMGHERTSDTGGLWCPDSFEDMHILRSLASQYKDQVGFFPIAVPPVFHSDRLGYGERVFLDVETGSELYQQAVASFVASTEQAFQAGTIPVQPWYDTEYNLLISAGQKQRRQSPQAGWHGAFRAANETQHYGVPNMWLIDGEGEIVAEPFRGNVYYPHGSPINISYSLKDVIAAIENAL